MKIMKNFVASCAISALLVPSLAQAKDAPPAGDFQDPVVSLGQCAFTANRAAPPPPPAVVDKAILPILAASLIGQLVNKVGDALSKMGDAKTWQTQASRNFERANGQMPQCFQLVRGSFLNSAPPQQAAWDNAIEPAKAALNANGTFPAVSPDFFFEGEIIQSSDKTAYTIRPIVSYMAKPSGTRTLRPDDERMVAVFLSITKPGESATLATAPGATLKLGKLRPATLKRYPIPASPDQSSPFDAAWFNLPKDYAGKPMTMNILQTETQGESAFLKFIGSVLSDQKVKDETSKQLQQQFIPSVGAQADLAAQAALFKLQTAAETTRLAAWDKLNVCIATPAKANEAKDALRSFANADGALPDGDEVKMGTVTSIVIETIKIGDPAATIVKQCTNVRDNYVKKPAE